MHGREADGSVEGPGEGRGTRLGSRQSRQASAQASSEAGAGRGSVLVAWFRWFQAQPVLATAFLVFCVAAVGGLVLSLPVGTLSIGRTSRTAGSASVSAPTPRVLVAPPEAPPAPTPDPAHDEAVTAGPGPWVVKAPSSPSARGLALVYSYRTLPPGGDSRYEWIVQVRGARTVLDGIDAVNWQMEPAAKNGADFISRDRAADGFPLFGHGPGGWFGVSATIHYRDGQEETLTRRIDLDD
jgi:hypothetical protein